MRSWPTLDLPKIDEELPPLTLGITESNSGVKLLEKDFSMYICGITPYDATHLGHAATYLTFDLIHRYQLAAGKTVHFVENITDIDDPLLERANRDHINWRELAEVEIELFRSDMVALRILPPRAYIGAVEAIPDVIEAILEFQNKGLTYELAGDIYLSLRKIPGAIENLPISYKEAIQIFRERGGDPDRAGKADPLDTILWMKQRPDEPGWSSPFGLGRPGWHIECTAISLKYLAQNSKSEKFAISLQGGGSDLSFPHHYMSGVQARALRDQEFANLYVHTGMIELDNEKMSKSRGNLVFVSQLLSSGISPMTIRIALMKEKYSKNRPWSSSLLASAAELQEKLSLVLSQPTSPSSVELRKEIVAALADDLDTPRVFKALDNWLTNPPKDLETESSGVAARFFDALLGITF